MRNKGISQWLKYFFMATLVVSLQSLKAQDDPPPILDPPPPSDCNPDDPDPGPDDPCIPIDGGLAFLLVAGVGYGFLKNRPSHNKEQENGSGNAAA